MVAGYKGHKAGSPRAQIHHTLDVDGEDAALRLGTQLGVKEKRVRRWIKRWSTGEVSNKRRVVWKFDPERNGVVLVDGDEVSSVLWSDGVQEYISNENLLDA